MVFVTRCIIRVPFCHFHFSNRWGLVLEPTRQRKQFLYVLLHLSNATPYEKLRRRRSSLGFLSIPPELNLSAPFLPRLGRGRRLSIDRGPDLNRFYPQPRLIQSAAMSLLSRPRSRSFCILLFVSALLLVLTPIYAEVSLSFILSVRFIIDCIYFPVQMWIECWLNFGLIRG